MEGRHEIFFDGAGGGDIGGGGDDVVAGLAEVDVIVGVDLLRLILADELARAVGDNLVRVHVGRGARSCLERVDHEVRVVLAIDDFLRGFDDRRGDVFVDEAELSVSLRRGELDLTQRLDEAARVAQRADREIERGALGARAIERGRGHVHLAHRVFFDACL